MKYAIIGTGKTGQAVVDLLPVENIAVVCNSRNPATLDKLKRADIGVVFVPGKAFGDVMPILMQSKLPMVIGTTGFSWPDDLDQQLRAQGLTWIIGQSFSIGLNIMRHFSEHIKKSMNALRPEPVKMAISETHHIHKLDAPSGTALYIGRVLGVPAVEIESIREGDANGSHTIHFDWPHDRISLTHAAHSRISFAEGVLLACQQIGALKPGLHRFEELADTMIHTALKG